ncbi:MAG: hypothetical protein WBM50_13740, partial [Acidimicrobiales bacterium]
MSTRNCQNCDAPFGPDDMFCENCGYDFITGSLPVDGVGPVAPAPSTAGPGTSAGTADAGAASQSAAGDADGGSSVAVSAGS